MKLSSGGLGAGGWDVPLVPIAPRPFQFIWFLLRKRSNPGFGVVLRQHGTPNILSEMLWSAFGRSPGLELEVFWVSENHLWFSRDPCCQFFLFISCVQNFSPNWLPPTPRLTLNLKPAQMPQSRSSQAPCAFLQSVRGLRAAQVDPSTSRTNRLEMLTFHPSRGLPSFRMSREGLSCSTLGDANLNLRS